MDHLWLFTLASMALIVAPGPDVLYVLTRGITLGRKAGLLSAAGVTVGILVHTLSASLGLAVVLRTSALAFIVIKLAGAGYLVYLGIKTLRDRNGLVLQVSSAIPSRRAVFGQGILSNVLNPKVALFFLAFLPQFVRTGSPHPTSEMIYLGIYFALLTVLFLCFVGLCAGMVGSWMQQRPALASRLHRATGGIFILLGLRLALLNQK